MASHLVTQLFVLTAFAAMVSATRQFVLVNNCPSGINVYANGRWDSWLEGEGGSRVRGLADDFSGLIYTDANGGSQLGFSTTRAGFNGDDGYYYLVTDPNYFNVEMSITPFNGPHYGFCVPARCAYLECPTAFTSPPTDLPPPSNRAPNPPLYACPQYPNDVGYTITFCPSGSFPPPPNPPNPPVTQGLTIHPNNNTAKCLDVRGAVYANGTPVQIYDCNGTGAQKWILEKANTQLRVAGTNFCLDAGSYPGNGVGMKIWTCYDGLAAQQWYYTDDNRIALTGQGLCLDLTNGVLTNGNQIQTWQCTDGDVYQIWTV